MAPSPKIELTFVNFEKLALIIDMGFAKNQTTRPCPRLSIKIKLMFFDKELICVEFLKMGGFLCLGENLPTWN
jgi:hypothetical protein